jgi:hypothetical protein
MISFLRKAPHEKTSTNHIHSRTQRLEPVFKGFGDVASPSLPGEYHAGCGKGLGAEDGGNRATPFFKSIALIAY